jgi:hypothetical protein
MLIDCDTCIVRGSACADCVVSALLGTVPGGAPVPPHGIELDDAERAAIGVLAEHGLVPPLRLVAGTDNPAAAGAPGVAATGDGRATRAS